MPMEDKTNIKFYIYDSVPEAYQDGVYMAKVNAIEEKDKLVTVEVVECEKKPDLIGTRFNGNPTIGNKGLSSSIDKPGYVGFFYIDSCREYILSRLRERDKEYNLAIKKYKEMKEAAKNLLTMAYLNRLINYDQIDKLNREIANQDKE